MDVIGAKGGRDEKGLVWRRRGYMAGKKWEIIGELMARVSIKLKVKLI